MGEFIFGARLWNKEGSENTAGRKLSGIIGMRSNPPYRVQREGGDEVDYEEFTGEVDCGGRRTAGREKI